ncbi:SH3 domain-containing protein [Halovulum dunhuangense]
MSAGLAAAQGDAPRVADPTPQLGPVTNLPLPRFVSIKGGEANVRRGPSLSHRIDWVFQRRNLPVEITAEYGNWRRVRDHEGAGGWVHYALLSGVRHVLVTAEVAALHRDPSPDAPLAARAERGVVARLDECVPDWCEVTTDGITGWIAKADIWGVAPDEIRD